MHQAPAIADTAASGAGAGTATATGGAPGQLPLLADAFAALFAQFMQAPAMAGDAAFATIPTEGGPLGELPGFTDLIAQTQQLLTDGLDLTTGEFLNSEKDLLDELGVDLDEEQGLSLEAIFGSLQIATVSLPEVDANTNMVSQPNGSSAQATKGDPATLPLSLETPALSVLGRKAEPPNIPANVPTQVGVQLGPEAMTREPLFPEFGSLETPFPKAEFKPTIPLSILPQETRVLQPPKSPMSDRGVDTDILPLNIAPETEQSQASSADRSATVLARVDRQEFVDRITEALRQAYREMPKKISFELTPPDLGKVRIQISESHGQLMARIESANPTARTLLNEHLPALEKHLAQSGIQLQRLEIQQPAESGSQQSSDGDGQQRHGQNNQQGQPEQGQQHRQQRQQQPNWHFNEAKDPRKEGQPMTMADLLALAPGMNRVI